MLTPIGKFLRKLRIDSNELLNDMADKLCVSSAFLSAVENGKKRMPPTWKDLIIDAYNLNSDQADDFCSAIAECENKIEIHLNDFSDEQKKLAITLARKFSDLDSKQMALFNKILKKGRT